MKIKYKVLIISNQKNLRTFLFKTIRIIKYLNKMLLKRKKFKVKQVLKYKNKNLQIKRINLFLKLLRHS